MAGRFDASTREGFADSEYAVYCPKVDAHGAPTGAGAETGLVYSARTRTLQGTLHCP
jgi:hypothetical protein